MPKKNVKIVPVNNQPLPYLDNLSPVFNPIVCAPNLPYEDQGAKIPKNVTVNLIDIEVYKADKFKFPHKDSS